MEYVYAALLLHATKQNITEAGITKVMKAASAEADSSRVKALIAALEGVDIEEAIKATPIAAAPVPAAAAAAESAPAAKEEEEEEEGVEGVDLGLASLFG
jgi:large subunit ribosomal protein L12